MAEHDKATVGPSGAVVVHAPWRTVNLAVSVALFGLFGADIALDFESRSYLIVLAILIAAGATSNILIYLSKIDASPDGVLIRRRRGHRRLAWADIHHFELRGYWRGLGVWTVGGEWVGVIQYGLFEQFAQQRWMALENYRWEQRRRLGLV